MRLLRIVGLALVVPGLASADEIRVMSSAGFFGVYAELGPAFERATGHRLITTRGPSMGDSPEAIPTRLARGEAADVVIMDGHAADELIAKGVVRPGSKVTLALSQVGMVVRAGAPVPDISTAAALTKVLLAAESIGYSDSGSGTYLSGVLFEKLGVASQIARKSRKVRGPPSGEPVAAAVARGELAIGFQQVSELIHVPGVTFVGPLPRELQPGFTFAGAITTQSTQPEAAAALLRFLASPDSAEIKRKHGLAQPVAAAAAAQQPSIVRTPGVQAGRDPNRAAFVAAYCKAQPAPAAAPVPAGPPPGGNAGRGANAAPPVLVPPDPAPAIPGVLAAGQRWRKVWEGTGNNTDGATGTDKGLLLAMNDLSQIMEISLDGRTEVIARDTFTGGAIAVRPDGELYVGERALDRRISRVSPRQVFAGTMNGEPLECLGPAVLNDMVADRKGGIYMTMGGVYYANARGVVSGRYGRVGGNGIVVSPDDRTLYVTGRLMGATPPADLELPAGAPTPTGGIVAFDIQPDGSLTNERQLAWAGNDGSAVDRQGRIYTPGNGGAWVIDPRTGAFLGYFPTPAGTHGLHFGGPDRRTLFAITLGVQTAVYAIDTLVQGYQATEWKR